MATTCPNIQIIQPSECIGDSLIKINDNFFNLQQGICSFDDNINVINTDTINLSFTTNTRILSANVQNSSINTLQIANNAIKTNKIDNRQVTSLKIGLQEVKTENIEDSAITRNKILDGEVIGNKLATSSVTTAKIGISQITYSRIQNVQTANRVLGSTVGGGQVQEVQINANMISNGEVTNQKLANMNPNTFKGRVTNSVGAPQDLTISQVQNMLGLAAISQLTLPVSISQGGTGVTTAAAARTALGAQATITGAATSIVTNDLSNNIVVVTNSQGKITNSTLPASKLTFLGDVTSNIQAQISSKQNIITDNTNLSFRDGQIRTLTAWRQLQVINRGDFDPNTNAIYCRGRAEPNNRWENMVIMADHRGMGAADLRSFYVIGYSPRMRMDVTEVGDATRHNYRLWAGRNLDGSGTTQNGFAIEVFGSNVTETGTNGIYLNVSRNGTFGRHTDGTQSRLITQKDINNYYNKTEIDTTRPNNTRFKGLKDYIDERTTQIVTTQIENNAITPQKLSNDDDQGFNSFPIYGVRAWGVVRGGNGEIARGSKNVSRNTTGGRRTVQESPGVYRVSFTTDIPVTNYGLIITPQDSGELTSQGDHIACVIEKTQTYFRVRTIDTLIGNMASRNNGNGQVGVSNPGGVAYRDGNFKPGSQNTPFSFMVIF